MRSLILLLTFFSISQAAGLDSPQARLQEYFDQRGDAHFCKHGTPRPQTRVDSSHSWDAICYNVDFRIFPEEQYLVASVIMGLEVLEPIDVIDYHLHAFTVDSVILEGEQLEFTREGDLLLVELGYTASHGDQLTLITCYRGEPQLTPGMGQLGMHFGSTIYTVSDPWGTRNWLACYDEPFDKAMLSLRATVPQPLVVASNGNLIGTEEFGDSLVAYEFSHSHPISTYLMTLTASEYATWQEEVDGTPLNYWVYPHHLSAAQEDFSTVPDMFTCFRELFGEYPFECYGMSVAPIYGGMGGMEHQTCTTLGHGLITGDHTYDSIVAHELSHMWWGDALTHVTFAEMWLHEGFATYCEGLYYQHVCDGDIEALYEYMEFARNTYLSWQSGFSNQPMAIYDPPLDYLFSALTYDKAACVLQTLRTYIGHDDFLQGLRDWYAAFQYQNICTADFRNIMEAASGEELDQFMEEWIYSPGYPEFEHLTASYPLPGDSTLVSLSVAQSSMFGNLFTPRVPITVTTSAGEFEELVQISGAADHYLFRLPGEFLELEFNPLHQVLATDQEITGVNSPVLIISDWEIDDSSGGDGDGNLSADELGWLRLLVENRGAWGEDISLSISSDDPLLVIEQDSAWVGTLDLYGESWTGWDLLLHNSHADILRYLELDIRYSGTGFEQDSSFTFRVGDPELLVVCDDTSGALLEYFEGPLWQLGQFWDVVDQSAGQSAEQLLPDYSQAIWYTGNARHETVTPDEQQLLTEWVDDGGQLLITGQHLLEDLWDSPFLSDFLYTAPLDSVVDIRMLNGVDDDPVGDAVSILLQGASGANNQVAPSSLTPLAGAAPVFTYQGSDEVGAVWTVDDVFFCAFGCEAVSGAGPTVDLAELLDRVFFTWDPEGVPFVPHFLPADISLRQNYPNPFNPVTAIEFTLPVPGKVELSVYNIIGQKVRVLTNGVHEAGTHRITFNADAGAGPRARPLPGGVYFYHLVAGDEMMTKKMVLLK